LNFFLKGLKWPLQNRHQQYRSTAVFIYAILLQDLMQRGVCRCGMEMPCPYAFINFEMTQKYDVQVLKFVTIIMAG
jgi:hypothetical protein